MWKGGKRRVDSYFGTASDWQALISKLNGVYAAHVVFSDEQEPREIHVLASSMRNSKSIVRDVQSAISARYGIDVDYHIISVAQVSGRMMTGLNFRLTYTGVSVLSASGKVESSVTLTKDNEQFVGNAIGSVLPFSRMRSIALATLDAVKACTGGTSFFELAGIELVRSCGRPIIITQVYCIPDCAPLIGCVFGEPDADAAVAQSVLDAINRKLEFYTQES